MLTETSDTPERRVTAFSILDRQLGQSMPSTRHSRSPSPTIAAERWPTRRRAGWPIAAVARSTLSGVTPSGARRSRSRSVAMLTETSDTPGSRVTAFSILDRQLGQSMPSTRHSRTSLTELATGRCPGRRRAGWPTAAVARSTSSGVAPPGARLSRSRSVVMLTVTSETPCKRETARSIFPVQVGQSMPSTRHSSTSPPGVEVGWGAGAGERVAVPEDPGPVSACGRSSAASPCSTRTSAVIPVLATPSTIAAGEVSASPSGATCSVPSRVSKARRSLPPTSGPIAACRARTSFWQSRPCTRSRSGSPVTGARGTARIPVPATACMMSSGLA